MGMAQARQVAKALRSLSPIALYSSPLPRALKTAEQISRQVPMEVEVMEGLKEVHLGELEGITGPEMRERYQWVFDAWRDDPSHLTFPGGESIRQLQSRAWKAVQHIENAHSDGVVVAVSHNFAISAIVSRFLGLPLTHFHRVRVDLGSITSLEFGTFSRYLGGFNDRCHLSAHRTPEG